MSDRRLRGGGDSRWSRSKTRFRYSERGGGGIWPATGFESTSSGWEPCLRHQNVSIRQRSWVHENRNDGWQLHRTADDDGNCNYNDITDESEMANTSGPQRQILHFSKSLQTILYHLCYKACVISRSVCYLMTLYQLYWNNARCYYANTTLYLRYVFASSATCFGLFSLIIR